MLLALTKLQLTIADDSLAEINPYTATFKLTYNGSLQSTPEATLEALGDDRYRYTLNADGVRGIALFLRAKTVETSEFLWNQGQPLPLTFKHHLKFLGKNDRWDAAFDWPANIVTVSTKGEDNKLELIPGTNDPFTFLLSLQRAVATGQTDINLSIVDKDQIEAKNYRVIAAENLKTALGCLPTIKVERAYNKKRKKYQYNWLAPDFDYMVVRNESGKENKRKVVLELTQLEFNGQVVTKMDRCNKPILSTH